MFHRQFENKIVKEAAYERNTRVFRELVDVAAAL
jgi:hypothetical protein